MSNVDVNKNKSEPLTGDGGVDFELEIKSNRTEEVVPLENATGVFQYLESILADSIGVSYTFGDAIGGNTAPNIVGTEEVNIKMTDNFGNKINLNSKNNNALYVTEVTPLIKESNKKMTTITMRSEEFIRNEQSISTIKNRYDGNISDSVKKILEYKPNDKFKFDYDFSFKNNLLDTNYELYGFEFYLNNLTTKFSYLNENNSILKNSYLQNETNFKFNENNSLIFKTRENKEKSFTEFYNLIYQYQNDCLIAGIEYNKEYYNDQDLKPSENLFFKISIIPFGGMNSPNLK